MNGKVRGRNFMFHDPIGDFMFQAIPIFIGIIFLIVISLFLSSIIKGVTQWNKNNHSPILDVMAKVVAKRTAIRGGGETRAYNNYYITFEFNSGDRIELEVKDVNFGMLVEGDQGMLKFQGTRYINFTRNGQMNG
jgi:hypothetical protein